MSNRIQPFHCSSQYSDWDDRNCGTCYKSYHNNGGKRSLCDLEKALGEAYFGDGKISQEQAERLGYNDETKLAYIWQCPEQEQKRPPRAPRKPKTDPDQLRIV